MGHVIQMKTAGRVSTTVRVEDKLNTTLAPVVVMKTYVTTAWKLHAP